ncbi:MAG: type I-E CRISPR-associated protein Cas7/Cse4/CasC [Nitrospira sp.]|nr:type I-E CRISPR-associated protein Cas7/Cse4/CasC [Nitrospira sp.]
MRIELHILQNFPPANLNRDDTGNPKDCEFGGYRRARISSQCLQRSIRTSSTFKQHVEALIGIRTKECGAAFHTPRIRIWPRCRDAKQIAEKLVGHLLGWDEKKRNTKVLFYVGYDELDRLASLVNEQWDTLAGVVAGVNGLGEDASKKDRETAEKALNDALDDVKKAFIKERKDQVKAVDIALFGRMLAEVANMNIDAACQVAHAISTNKVDMDFDYFTAVDDLNVKDETGAGMIGTVGFNSSCFYRYALIDAGQLAKNLGGDRSLATDSVLAFIDASVAAIPSGKQNSFAAQTPPVLVMAVVRPENGMPWSLVNAFEKPVAPRNGSGLVEDSVQRLDTHWSGLVDMYGMASGTQVFVKAMNEYTGGLKSLQPHQVANIPALLESVAGAIAPWAGGGA